MNIASIKIADCANGPGMRVSLFVSGCRNHCKGCFNKETWDFAYGAPYTQSIEDKIIATLKQDEYDGLTVLGGEPLDPLNLYAVCSLVKRVNMELDKSIWVYTGYTWEMLIARILLSISDELLFTKLGEILNNIDVLVDGPFIDEEKDITLKFRGSRNQRIIDVPKSICAGKVILATEWM